MTHSLRMRACLAAVTASIAVALPAAAAAEDVVPGQVIVRYEPGSSSADRADARDDAGTKTVEGLGMARAQLLKITDGGSVDATIRQLEAQPGVAYAEPNEVLRPAELFPNDPRFLSGDQWGLLKIGGPQAWDFSTGSPDTVVAVMDTGADLGHPDLANQLWSNPDEIPGNGIDDDGGFGEDVHGYDFYSGDADPFDLNGHGTHVSGIIGAEGNNGIATAGVDWHVALMELRICGPYESGCPVSSEIQAINYAASHGARVLNGSISGSGRSTAVEQAIASHPGTLYVFAAGNGDSINHVGYNVDSSPTYPCASDQGGFDVGNVICVAATTEADQRASFSNYGANSVDLGAPGTNILSSSAQKAFLVDDFEGGDFAAKWSTASGPGWSPTSEAPLSSVGITDSPGDVNYPPSTVNTEISSPITIGPAYSTCERLAYYRSVELSSGDSFQIAVLRNGEAQPGSGNSFTFNGPYSDARSTYLSLGSDIQPGDDVQVRLRLSSDGTNQSDGVHMDDIKLVCNGSPSDGGTELMSGTSMATPMVTGAAGLLFSQVPATSPQQVKTELLDSVDPLQALSGITVSGGRLNVYRALSGDVNPAGGGTGGEGSSGTGTGSGSGSGSGSSGNAKHRPNTSFKRKPRRVVRTAHRRARVVFKFRSSEAGSSFRCRLDRSRYRACSRRLVRRLRPGAHRLKVQAVGPDGLADATAAVARFRIKRVVG